MVPFHHYVPVDFDLGNLLERIAWLQDNPDAARAIGKNALCRLTKAAAIEAWIGVLHQLGSNEDRGLPSVDT
ncbi:MAG: hypothetical protein EOO77_34285 [Oxalobacteraceae bacterium]|nr:MAG: hypothetical protein EOO77_34285 [Oxalobacteraceae bacterium]